jgi:acetyl-CoA acetyltransferase
MSYIAGIGVNHPGPDQDPSLEELVFGAASAALHDAHLDRADIDGVCIASSDQLDGRAISSMHLAGPAGGRLRDEVKVTDDGSMALAAAALRVEAGLSDRVLVVSWTKPDASDTAAALSVNPEPIFLRPVSMHPWVAEAMVVEEFMRLAGLSHAQADAWAARLSGRSNQDDGSWFAYPIKVEHMPPPSQGAVALVVTAGASDVRLQGISWGADPANLTQRKGLLGSLPDIAARAFAEAGLTDLTGIPVETTDRSVIRGLMNAVGLGLMSADSVAAVFDSSPPPNLNSSGGLWRSNPVFAAGLECVARAAQQVRAGARCAVGHSNYGYAGQGNLVAVLGRS